MRNKKKAFVVEDDQIAQSIIKRILKSNKTINSFEFYSNGLAALVKINTLTTDVANFPDFIILDYDMPQMNGQEFLEKIKNLEGINQIPIFMNSASNDLKEFSNCLKYNNVKGFFSKPFSHQILHSILKYLENN